jgi:hypothetical protein
MAKATLELPPIEFLNEWFYMDGPTLKWKRSPANRVKPGDPFGTPNVETRYNGASYMRGMVKGYGMIRAHRIAYMLHHPNEPVLRPSEQIDHLDGNGFNNAKGNLRRTTHKDNHHNKPTPVTNTSGVMGVNWDKRKRKWRTEVRWRDAAGEKCRKFLGYFDVIADAEATRRMALDALGFSQPHGRKAAQ